MSGQVTESPRVTRNQFVSGHSLVTGGTAEQALVRATSNPLPLLRSREKSSKEERVRGILDHSQVSLASAASLPAKPSAAVGGLQRVDPLYVP